MHLGKKILLIDDDRAMKYLTRIELERVNAQCAIAEVSNGLEAIEVLESGLIQPDVIFLDLEMPKMNGYEFLREYQRKQLHLMGMKLYVLTTLAKEFNEDELMDQGIVSGVFDKPLNANHILKLYNDFNS